MDKSIVCQLSLLGLKCNQLQHTLIRSIAPIGPHVCECIIHEALKLRRERSMFVLKLVLLNLFGFPEIKMGHPAVIDTLCQ